MRPVHAGALEALADEGFAGRFADATKVKVRLSRIMGGHVSYDKGMENDDYFWGDNVFQKHPRYSYQNEYRFALDECPGYADGRIINCKLSNTDYIELTLGACTDLIHKT